MKLILMRGLPASGKSTRAKKLLEKHNGNYKRVNRDLLREMIDAGKWSKNNEKLIVAAEIELAEMFLNLGYNVIVDDTNLPQNVVDKWNEFTVLRGATFEIVDFMDVPVEECIKRDQKRQNYVGEKVIRRMARQNLCKKLVQDKTLPHAIICDLDGTLADFEGLRSPYAEELCEGDRVNEAVRLVINSVREPRRIILVSGRSDAHRPQTERWLKNNEIEYLALHMRKAGDTRNDYIVKSEIFNEHIKNKYYISFVLDDRDRIVDFWRSIGLNCFQINYGDF